MIWKNDLRAGVAPIYLALKSNLRFICSSATCALLLAQAAQANPQVLAWKLSQVSSSWGNCNVYISNDAIRIDAQDRNFFVLSKSPKWNIQIVSDKKKLSYSSGTKWEGSSVQRLGCDFGQVKEYKQKQVVFMALPATLYASSSKKRIDNLLNFNKFEESQKKSYSSDIRYTVVQCKNAPKSAVAILEKFYDVPSGSQQVPVSLLHMEDSERAFRLKTKAIAQVKVDASVFSAKTYPKAAKAEAIILPPTAEATDDMLKDAGFF
ncbi:MAG: hypothetical protein C0508_04545 [Cyanobacteria bacterium PR.023]|jgi:hypothetical protein|nr:hypothetical protein [Cyanobacteria bacterium PR.023]MDQ5936633.1 hypothetical protein [Cyanobacteriota bacterium erpe_2018_sw_21hr_WHONDRS-SW48-000092_B_bin.40]